VKGGRASALNRTKKIWAGGGGHSLEKETERAEKEKGRGAPYRTKPGEKLKKGKPKFP